MPLFVYNRKINFDFVALSEYDQVSQANTQKLKADTMVALINAGVVSHEECRQVLADDIDSCFANIDIDDVPEMPNDYQDQFTSETSEYNQESEQRPISEHRLLKKGDDVRRKVGENIGGNIEDAKGKFEESKHPRDNDGKFTTGNSKNTKSSIFQQPQDSKLYL